MLRKRLKIVVALFVATIILSECNDASFDATKMMSAKNKTEIVNKPIKEQYKYVGDNLSIIQKAFLPLTKSPEFRELLYSEVAQQFDGDENVLLQELFKRNSNLVSELMQSRFLNNSNDISKSLDAFVNIGMGRDRFTLYPQIYIHNFFNFKNKGFATPNPAIVVFSGDESMTTFEGLRLTLNGDMEKISVDENFASQNEVWVISLNENYKGKSMKEFRATVKERQKYTGDCISTPSCDRTAIDWAHIEMNKLLIDCQWETWVQGNADVSITRVVAFEDAINPVTQEYQDPHFLGDNTEWTNLISVDNSNIGNCFDMNYIA